MSEPAPAAASKPYGYGAYGSAGLFTNHDQTGKCVLNAMCTAAQCAAGTCNGGNMCCPTSIYGTTDIDMSKKAGYPAQLVGNSLGGTIGGVPQAKAPAFGTSASIDPTKFNNYKLVWTPKWLAWMINSVVMRNETVDLGRQTVPWYVNACARRISRPRELSFSVFYSQAPGHAAPSDSHQQRLRAHHVRHAAERRAQPHHQPVRVRAGGRHLLHDGRRPHQQPQHQPHHERGDRQDSARAGDSHHRRRAVGHHQLAERLLDLPQQLVRA